MRKILSKTEQKKKEQLKQLVVGGVLILIMFTSVLGYAFQSQLNKEESKVTYNEFEFVKNDNYWVLENTFAFKYNPLETEDFIVKDLISQISSYSGKPLYIYSESQEAETEIYNNLGRVAQRIQYACLNDEDSMDCIESWPIKTCQDNFIIVHKGQFEVIQKENCLFISGDEEDLVRISDEVLFKILGVKI